MPYIPQDRRLHDAETSGELNHTFSVVINDYLELKGESYQTYNDIIGALQCQILELYRRKIAPYEDKKIEENGDVY